jgi:hypothetical protein
MLILKDDDDDTKIRGRAIVWNLDEPDRMFMDRIYTFYDSDVDKFKDYAKKNEWLYKSKQNMGSYEKIVDTKTSELNHMDLYIEELNDTGKYPYMDTMKYYDLDTAKLTNKDDYFTEYYLLEDLSGGYDYINNEEEDDRIYVDFYGDFYEPDDLEWCENVDEYRIEEDRYWSEFYNCWNDTEYADHNMIKCKYCLDKGDPFRDTVDCKRLEYYRI